MESKRKIRVLFVCTGNICRSPMAEAVFQDMVNQAGLGDRFEIASAATTRWEVGERPHQGTQAVLRKHSVRLDPSKRAQEITREMFTANDYVIGMDAGHVADLSRYGKVRRLLEFASDGVPLDLADPYYTLDFDTTYQHVEDGCRGLLEYIRKKERL